MLKFRAGHEGETVPMGLVPLQEEEERERSPMKGRPCEDTAGRLPPTSQEVGPHQIPRVPTP